FIPNPTVADFEIAVIPPRAAEQPARFAASDITLCPVTPEHFLSDMRRAAIRVHRKPVKTAAYFFNRYVRHPFYRYSVYLMTRETVPIGLVTTRIVTHQHARARRIIDLIIDS